VTISVQLRYDAQHPPWTFASRYLSLSIISALDFSHIICLTIILSYEKQHWPLTPLCLGVSWPPIIVPDLLTSQSTGAPARLSSITLKPAKNAMQRSCLTAQVTSARIPPTWAWDAAELHYCPIHACSSCTSISSPVDHGKLQLPLPVQTLETS
jgi:hypothetical protein